MFSFCKQKKGIFEVFAGMTDCHSHILPGVDDGVKTEEDAFEILEYLEKAGVKRVTFTPHIMQDYPNRADALRDKFRTFKNSYTGSIELSLGGEYMLDEAFEELLDTQELLTISDNYLLVETSYMYCPLNFDELLEKVRSKGYYVVLAHPERYVYMDADYYKRLKARKIRFQLNLLSLTGVYGERVRVKAEELLMQGAYDCVGSDIHNLKAFRKYIEQTKLSKRIIDRVSALKGGIEE